MTVISLFLMVFFFFFLSVEDEGDAEEAEPSHTNVYLWVPLRRLLAEGPWFLNTESADSASQEPSETNRSAFELSA